MYQFKFKFKVCSGKKITYQPCIYHIQPNKHTASFFLGGGGVVMLLFFVCLILKATKSL